MDYLWLRAATYWFSLRIPIRHRASYGSVHLRVRIGRVDAIEARRRAQVLAAHAGLGMETGMERDVLMRSLAALSAELAELRRDRMSAGFRMLNSRDIAAEAALDHDAEMAEQWSDAAAQQEARLEEIDRVRKRLERLGLALDADGVAWEGERRAYERAVASASNVAIEAKAALLAAQAQVMTISPPPAEHRPPESEETSDIRSVTRDTLLSVAAWPVVDARCAALLADEGNRYADHVRLSLRSFLEIVGDKPLRHYVPADIQEYANLMARVPINLPKKAVFKGMTFREAAEANDARLTPFRCMASSTIDKYLTEVRGIWERATAAVVDVRDIGAASVTMPRNAEPTLDREPFSHAELTKWFVIAAKHREPEFRWLPVVALLTGMRLSEIVYLKATDFVDFEDHLVIDLRRFVADGRP